MLAKVPKNSEVLVVGSKQSAIDATLLLCREGHRVTMTSPSGELPAVRTRLIPGDRFPIDRGALMQLMSLWDPNDPQLDITRLRLKYLRYLAKEIKRLGDIPVSRQLSNSSSAIRRLEEEINISERNYCKWENSVVGFVDAINDIHIRDFKESIFNVEPEFKRKLMRYIASIAVPNARKVLRLLYNDNLCIKRGEVTAVEISHARVKPWKVTWEDDERRFDAVVCAAGFENHRYSFDEAGALIPDKEVQPQGSVIDFADDLSIRNPRTNEKENIWISGSATHLKIMTSSAVFLAIPQVRLAINELKRRILCSNKDGGVDEKIAV
ncbi:hypothetical protein [Chelativorans sp. M5D2P16]|uniref:hypothetical protein n=1 Tax=Chelativorans sp. M5D2P16 TaxID=3095678 RepID=UPI002ACA97AA|nr:hypothetical protein [Chelativorans sp. M5D2P16]MDZ5696360.1 hypothetical protein [Chelativorans sp. M5D2P16]